MFRHKARQVVQIQRPERLHLVEQGPQPAPPGVVAGRLSDAYGYPFSDVGPKKVLAPLNARTAKLEITILPDRERHPSRECRT